MNALNITNSFIPVATREEIIFLPWNADKIIVEVLDCLLVKHQCSCISYFKTEVE